MSRRKKSHQSHGTANRPRFWGRHAVAAALDNPNRKVLRAWATREAAAFMQFPKDVPLTLAEAPDLGRQGDRKSTRLNSSHTVSSYAVFCLKKKNKVEDLLAAPATRVGPDAADALELLERGGLALRDLDERDVRQHRPHRPVLLLRRGLAPP